MKEGMEHADSEWQIIVIDITASRMVMYRTN